MRHKWTTRALAKLRSGRRPETRHGGWQFDRLRSRHPPTFWSIHAIRCMNAADGTFTEPTAHSGPPRQPPGGFYLLPTGSSPVLAMTGAALAGEELDECTSRLRLLRAGHNAGGKNVACCTSSGSGPMYRYRGSVPVRSPAAGPARRRRARPRCLPVRSGCVCSSAAPARRCPASAPVGREVGAAGAG